MSEEEILKELKSRMDRQQNMIEMLLAGSIATSRRIDTLETLVTTMSKLVQITSDMVTEHLVALRNVNIGQKPPVKAAKRGVEIA